MLPKKSDALANHSTSIELARDPQAEFSGMKICSTKVTLDKDTLIAYPSNGARITTEWSL